MISRWNSESSESIHEKLSMDIYANGVRFRMVALLKRNTLRFKVFIIQKLPTDILCMLAVFSSTDSRWPYREWPQLGKVLLFPDT